MEHLVRDDETVTGSESLRHEAGEVQPLFNEDFGIMAELLDLLQLLQHERHILIRVAVHLVAVVLADGLLGAHL